MLSRSCVLLALVGFSACSSIERRDASRACDPATCTGPVYYYQELGCIPIYENSSSCCPIRYNCDHWKNLPDSKCFVNGRVYESGDVLPVGEVGDSCIRCICNGGNSGPSCVVSSCAGSKDGCYLKQSPFQCCSTVEVCPEKESDVPTCSVDGKTYKDGDRFTPAGEPNKICYCAAGYNGENVEPFCITRKPGSCGNALMNTQKIRDNCPPVYDHDDSPRRNCNSDYRCYNDEKDSLLDIDRGTGSQPNGITACLFGNASVAVGKTLQLTDVESSKIRCICEVPPVMTCHFMA